MFERMGFMRYGPQTADGFAGCSLSTGSGGPALLRNYREADPALAGHDPPKSCMKSATLTWAAGPSRARRSLTCTFSVCEK